MTSFVHPRALAIAGMLMSVGTAASSDAFLNYARLPSDAGSQAFVVQITNYPAFRPIIPAAPAQQPKPQGRSAPVAEPTQENVTFNLGQENITLSGDGAVKFVPRPQLQGN